MIAGPEALCAQLQAAVGAALGKARDAGKELAAVRDMRARIAAERGEGGDPWDIKLGRGGMQDIELCLQAGKVLTPGVAPVAPRAMIPPLVAAGWLTAQEGAELEAVLGRLQAIQQRPSALGSDGRSQTFEQGFAAVVVVSDHADQDEGRPKSDLDHPALTVLQLEAGLEDTGPGARCDQLVIPGHELEAIRGQGRRNQLRQVIPWFNHWEPR